MGFLIRICAIVVLAAAFSHAADKIEYWQVQRKGANFFNEVETAERFAAAKSFGIELVRLAPNKWKSASRDFLIGNADEYQGIVEADFQQLKSILDAADSIGVKVVLTMLSFPGCRWKQQNGEKDDDRIWRDWKFHHQSAQFWRDLAQRLKGHPAIVGYNPLNEPHPSEELRYSADSATANINSLYAEVIAAIRSVDSTTPIVLDAGNYASPDGMPRLLPVADSLVLYSFHFYEPWEMTTFRANQGRYSYPDRIPGFAFDSTDVNSSGRAVLTELLRPVVAWQTKYKIPGNRIYGAEFGCDRRIPGVERYFADLITIFNREGWHWSYYSFREDTWDGMDYELGDKPLGWEYWKAVERGETPERKRVENPIFDVIRKEFAR